MQYYILQVREFISYQINLIMIGNFFIDDSEDPIFSFLKIYSLRVRRLEVILREYNRVRDKIQCVVTVFCVQYTKGCVLVFSPINIFSGRSQYVSLAGVPPELVVVPTAEPTTPPPTLPPPTCGAPNPPLRVGLAEEHARLEGSEYIAFSSSQKVLNYTRER